MFKRVIFIKALVSFYLFSILLYAVFRYGLNEDFVVNTLFARTSILNTYFYLYFALISIGFAITTAFLFKYYISKKIVLRMFVFFPLLGLLTCVIGGFFCGILFGIHDMQVGFYPGISRFISNMFGRGIEVSLLGVLIAFNSLAIYTSQIIINAIGLLEFLMHKQLK